MYFKIEITDQIDHVNANIIFVVADNIWGHL